MNEEEKDLGFSQEIEDFISSLLEKAVAINEKTESHSNVHVDFGSLRVPVRVDDHQLLYIGGRLLPNILNYLVNILPQFLYPYVVSYLQNLSEMRDDPITINELYNYLITLENGNLFNRAQTES